MRKLIWLVCLGAFALTSCKQSSKVQADNTVSQREIDQYKREIDRLKAQLTQKDDALSDITNQNAQIQQKLSKVETELEVVYQQMQETSDDYGVWFRVQIGAYEDSQISKELETTDQMALEGDDLQKIVLGRFRNYDDAKRLQQHLQQKGMSDAWVVSYKDGKRVPIEEVRN